MPDTDALSLTLPKADAKTRRKTAKPRDRRWLIWIAVDGVFLAWNVIDILIGEPDNGLHYAAHATAAAGWACYLVRDWEAYVRRDPITFLERIPFGSRGFYLNLAGLCCFLVSLPLLAIS